MERLLIQRDTGVPFVLNATYDEVHTLPDFYEYTGPKERFLAMRDVWKVYIKICYIMGQEVEQDWWCAMVLEPNLYVVRMHTEALVDLYTRTLRLCKTQTPESLVDDTMRVVDTHINIVPSRQLFGDQVVLFVTD